MMTEAFLLGIFIFTSSFMLVCELIEVNQNLKNIRAELKNRR